MPFEEPDDLVKPQSDDDRGQHGQHRVGESRTTELRATTTSPICAACATTARPYHGGSNRADDDRSPDQDQAPRRAAGAAAQISLAGAQPERRDQHRERLDMQKWYLESKMSTANLPLERHDRHELRRAKRRAEAPDRSCSRTRTASSGLPLTPAAGGARVMTVQRRGAAIDIVGPAQGICQRRRARVLALDNIDLSDRGRRIRLHRRAVGLRKVDAAAHPRRPRPPDLRHHHGPCRRAGRSRTRWCSRRAGCFPG